MALIDSDGARSRPRLFLALLSARLRAWLFDNSDHALTQRVAGTAFLIRVASAALLYLSQVVLARWMGGHEFGIFVYVWTWVLLVGGLLELGLAVAAQRFIPEYTERKAIALLRGYVNGSRWLAVGIATVAAVLAIGAIRLAEPRLDDFVIIPLYLGCLCLPFYVLTSLQDGISRSYGWVHLALVPPFILRPLLLIAVMAVAYFAGLPADATTAMSAAVVATWATAILQLVIVNSRLAKQIEPGPAAYAVRIWLATALPIFMVESFYLMLTYTDILVLEQFQPPEEVAHYYAASKTLALVAFVNFAVSAAAAHKFTAYHVAGDRARLAAFVAGAVRWTFWPSLAATLLILMLGRPLLWLFGKSFLDAYYLMFILSIGLLARAAVGPVERLLNMLGEQRACALAYGTAFAINLILNLVLIPHLGAAGAAIATSAALTIESALLFWVTKRRLGLHAFIWRRSGSPAPKAPTW